MMTVDEALRHERDRLPFELEMVSIDAMETLAAEVRRLREENERLRVQLAGCGVAAMQNTADSRAHRINRDDYGWSASYADVCSAVDREISLREENERLRNDAERMIHVGLFRDLIPLAYKCKDAIRAGNALDAYNTLDKLLHRMNGGD